MFVNRAFATATLVILSLSCRDNHSDKSPPPATAVEDLEKKNTDPVIPNISNETQSACVLNEIGFPQVYVVSVEKQDERKILALEMRVFREDDTTCAQNAIVVTRYHSASMKKLQGNLDEIFWSKGTEYAVPGEDQARLLTTYNVCDRSWEAGSRLNVDFCTFSIRFPDGRGDNLDDKIRLMQFEALAFPSQSLLVLGRLGPKGESFELNIGKRRISFAASTLD